MLAVGDGAPLLAVGDGPHCCRGRAPLLAVGDGAPLLAGRFDRARSKIVGRLVRLIRSRPVKASANRLTLVSGASRLYHLPKECYFPGEVGRGLVVLTAHLVTGYWRLNHVQFPQRRACPHQQPHSGPAGAECDEDAPAPGVPGDSGILSGTVSAVFNTATSELVIKGDTNNNEIDIVQLSTGQVEVVGVRDRSQLQPDRHLHHPHRSRVHQPYLQERQRLGRPDGYTPPGGTGPTIEIPTVKLSLGTGMTSLPSTNCGLTR